MPGKTQFLMIVALFLSFTSAACLENFFQNSSDDAGASRSIVGESKTHLTPGSKASSVLSGSKPDFSKVPGPDGPFVEPPLKQRPQFVYLIIVESAPNPWKMQTDFEKLASLKQVPIGYPAVDQDPSGKGFVLIAGKFARAEWAKALADSLNSESHLSVRVVQKPYEFDRLKPAANSQPGYRAGRVFAGVTGMSVPVLSDPGSEASGSGFVVADGALVAVLGEKWLGNRLWLEVKHKNGNKGFVPAGRLVVDANLFPAPGGAAAILGITLGCKDAHCRWDYWLVGNGFTKRRLLKSAGERMPHSFSPNGKWLAYTTFDPSILVTSTVETKTLELGPGISPSFSPDGKLLYFRGPGVRGKRDDVRVSQVSTWKAGNPTPPVRSVLDFKGTPVYPRAISTVPPRVDFLQKGQLFTLFFRLGKKVAKKSVHRWGVIFTPGGKILETAGVAISD